VSTAARQLRNAYDPFALIYNRGMAEDFCGRALPVITKLLLTGVPSGAHILDLCCGSGQMARELTHRGYHVVGLDGSQEMIRIAKKNAPFAKFVLADARNFSLAAQFDAVLSSFNSLSHASTSAELLQILRNARASLKPNGTLLFDLSMEHAYTAKWRGSFGDTQPDLAWIVQPSYNRQSHSAKNDVTLFTRSGENWRRIDFTICQRCFSEEEVCSALADAGFTQVSHYDAEADLGMANESGRQFFLCH
jgi:SAM-dependent methyltransferase